MASSETSSSARRAEELLDELRRGLEQTQSPVHLEKQFGQAVRTVRKAARVVQEQLARTLDCSQTAIWRLETGGSEPHVGQRNMIGSIEVKALDAALAAGGYLEQIFELLVEHRRSGAPRSADRSAKEPARPWFLPRVRSRVFGADKHLSALTSAAQNARDNDQDALVVVEGAVGAGKSTVVKHWAAYRVNSQEWWPGGIVHYDLREAAAATARDQLADLLTMVGVDPPEAARELELRGLWLQVMRERDRMLIILDNADSTAMAEPLCPTGSRHVVVITGVNLRSLVLTGATRITVSALDSAVAVTMLASYLADDRVTAEPAAAVKLVDFCGRLPLAIAVVGERLARLPFVTLTQVADEFRDLQTARDGLLAQLYLTGRDGVLANAIKLSYDQLPDHTPAARLFALLGLLPRGATITSHMAAALLDVSRDIAEAALDILDQMSLVNRVAVDEYRQAPVFREYAAAVCAATDSDCDTDRSRAIPEAERSAAIGRVVAYYADAAAAAAHALGATELIVAPARPLAVTSRQRITGPREAMSFWNREAVMVYWAIQQAPAHLGASVGWQLAVTAASWHGPAHDLWEQMLELGLRAAEHDRDPYGIAWLRHLRGEVARTGGDTETAEVEYRAGLEAACRAGWRWGEWWIRAGLAAIAMDHAGPAAAAEQFTRMDEILTSPTWVDDAPTPRAAVFTQVKAKLLAAQRALHADQVNEVREHLNALGNDAVTTAAIGLLRAPLLATIGEIDTALAELNHAAEEYARLGDVAAHVGVLRNRAAVLRAARRDTEAVEADRQAAALSSGKASNGALAALPTAPTRQAGTVIARGARPKGNPPASGARWDIPAWMMPRTSPRLPHTVRSKD